MGAEAVALVNTDVVLAPDWLERAVAALEAAPGAASVATKLVDLDDPSLLYDAGDVLRRDGVCEQRGRFERDDGGYDEPGEVFSACAGAALYRRSAVLAAGGFEERFGTYLEDVDLGLRLRLAGWSCRWEPRAVARHAGGGSSAALRARPRRVGGAQHAAARRARVPAALAAARRLPPARLGLARGARRPAPRAPGGSAHGAAAAAGVRCASGGRCARPRSSRSSEAVPARPIRGPRAGGHPSRHASLRMSVRMTLMRVRAAPTVMHMSTA